MSKILDINCYYLCHKLNISIIIYSFSENVNSKFKNKIKI